MQLKKEEAIRVFKKLNMKIREGKDTWAFFWHEDNLILRTRVSHGRGDVAGNIAHKIRTQLKLDEEQFSELKKCDLTLDKYIQILKEKGIL